MKGFPEEIEAQIVSYVPSESVLNCKLVCKRWLQLLSNRKVCLGMIFSFKRLRRMHLYYADYEAIKSPKLEEDEDFYETRITKINLPPVKPDHEPQPDMIGSYNGLVCLAVYHNGVDDPVYICNPLTCEYINLPKLQGNDKLSLRECEVVSGFGYLPSTNEYKVVRILYRVSTLYRKYRSTTNAQVQVYTLGSSNIGWRNIGETYYSLYKDGVLANSSLYWMDRHDRIVAFNLADEQFRVLPTPPCIQFPREFVYKTKLRSDPVKDVNNICRYWLIMLGGHLCLVDHPGYDALEIWSFRKTKHQENETSYETTGPTELLYYHDWSWNKDFSMELGKDGRVYKPFALTKNNEVLMWTSYNTLECYNPVTKSLHVIVDGDSSLGAFRGILHMNTHVSVKDLERTTLEGTTLEETTLDQKKTLEGTTPKTWVAWATEFCTAIFIKIGRFSCFA